jgi:ribonucleoside-diphosphate reductase alpha chain
MDKRVILSDEAYQARLEGREVRIPSETARRVLERRYLRRDDQGTLCETPAGLYERVALHVAGAEPGAERARAGEMFAGMMRRGHFLPNSPTLMNAGLPEGQLAACFVLPVGDSIGDIFDAVKNMALVQKTGGGTGFAFSALRPAGDLVSTTKGVSSGPLTFMEVFNTATDTIRQGGRRRGANMGVLEVHHPDVLRFITEKADPDRLTNFNLSVGLTDPFMRALETGSSFALVNPRNGDEVGQLDARRTFELLARCAWLSGEPGVLFLDRINADNPTPGLGRLEATNPCGELPLLPYESCNLGSLNLGRFVQDDALDWSALGAAVRWGVRFLDNVIDTTTFPLPEVADATARTRKIGLGVMGFADLLIRLGVGYDTPRGLALATEVMSFVRRESRRASENLARTRGPFPAYQTDDPENPGEIPRRNATTNTIAPTGTLSILAGCSAGIEPLFAPAYHRRFLDGEEADEVHPLFAERLEKLGLLTDDLVRRVAEAGHARVKGIPADLAQLLVTAHEVSPHHHVAIQAAFQDHVDNSVSKTVNLPADATEQDVAEVIRLAHSLGCKGITVYRDASRPGQVLSTASASAPGITPASVPCPSEAPEACSVCGAEPLTVPPGEGRIHYCPDCAWSRL